MFLVTTSYNLQNFRCLLTVWNWYFVLVVAYFVRLEIDFWGWRWLCCLETGCSEAQYLWFSQRSQDCGIQHDNDTSFNIYIDGRWYYHTIIHISSIWQWNLYLNHLESMNDLCFLCSIRYLRATCLSCNHVSTRLHTSWRAWLPEQFASSRHSIDPLSPEPRISAHSAIKSNIIHTNPNLSFKKKASKKKKTSWSHLHL